MTDYEFWERALAGEKVGGPTLPVHDGEAYCGFWRRRASKSGPYLPVAIWRAGGGDLICLVNGKPADAAEQWSYCCRNAVSEENYHARINTGKWWDESDAVTNSLTPPPAGHNVPPTDEAETIQGQIEAAYAGVAEYSTISDDETAAKAQSLRSRLLELSGQADKRREALVRPHLDGQRAVNDRWQPLVKAAKAAKAAADTIRAALSAHETAKDRATKAAKAEWLRLESLARQAAEDAEKAGKPVPVQPAPPPAAPVPEPAVAIRGAYGRAASVKMVRIAKVQDYDEATTYFRNNPEYRAVIDKLAQRATDAGITVPGVEVTEEKKVV